MQISILIRDLSDPLDCADSLKRLKRENLFRYGPSLPQKRMSEKSESIVKHERQARTFKLLKCFQTFLDQNFHKVD